MLHPSPDVRPRSPLPLLVVLGTLLGAGARPAGAQVILNEFERTGSGTDRIELYNTRPDTTYDLSGWFLQNQLGATYPLSGPIGPNAHVTVTTTGAIVTEGGLIELYDGILANPRDSVPFGDQGGAPLPPPTGAFSCGRAPDGTNTGKAAADWNLDPTSTFSAANDQAAAGLGATSVFLNEAGQTGLRSEGPCLGPVVELYNHESQPMDVTNWWLVDGRAVVPLFGVIPPEGFLVISDFPPEFCFEETGVLYLFDPPGRRVDQVGVHGVPVPPVPPESYQRVPDGAVPFGPYDGFDFPSSGGGVSWLVLPNTLGVTNVTDPLATGGALQSSTWGGTKVRYRE